MSENSRISDVNVIEEKLTVGENRELKKKLSEMMRKQGDLQKQIDFYNSNNKTTHFQSNDISNIKLTEMSANYLKEIKKLKKQIAEL